MAAESNVQLVEAEELNDIDSKADAPQPPPADSARISEAHASGNQASVSWLQSIWSALGNIFTALATAAHQLLGL
jgi:hypothetical protein